MKIALIADTQFDSQESLSRLLPSGITSRLFDQITALEWTIANAVERGCTELFTLGDIFDSRTELNLAVIDRVCRAYYTAHHAEKLKLTFLVGNHDAYLRSSAINSLQMFRGYADVVDTIKVVGDFAFLPWVEDLETIKEGVKALAGSKAKYLFMHGIIHGAVHKSVAGIPLEVVRPERWKRVFLGDVHEPRDMAPNVHYVGSFMQLHFGDAGGFRGYVILDTDTGKFERVENEISPRFHIIREGKAGPLTSLRKQDFVSVEIEDPEAAAEITASVRKKADWVRSVSVEMPQVKPRLDIHSNQEHREVLQHYCKHHNVDDPDLIEMGLDFLKQARAGA